MRFSLCCGAEMAIGTNTYLIGTGKKRILLDTGEGKDEYLPILNKVLEQENIEIQVNTVLFLAVQTK